MAGINYPGVLCPELIQQFWNQTATQPAAPVGGVNFVVYSYLAGTTIPTPTYTDASLGVFGGANPNPVVLNASGQASIFLNPAIVYKFVYTTSNDTNPPTSPIYTQDNINPPLSSANLATAVFPIINPQSSAEQSLNITPTNYAFPPMYVDRYTVNQNPGSTDMSGAFSTAFAVAQVQGGTIRYGASGVYGLSATVNFTTSPSVHQYGVTFRSETGPGFNRPQIVANMATGHMFDMTGTQMMVWENISIGGSNLLSSFTSTGTPQTAVFQSRVAPANSSVGITRFKNCVFAGGFTVATYYNYGAEDDVLDNCYIQNTSNTAGLCCAAWTANNYALLSSTFQTVPGNGTTHVLVSNLDHKVFGGEFFMEDGGAQSDCIHLEASDSLKIYGSWMKSGRTGTGPGRSLIYLDMTYGSSNYACIYGLTGEQASPYNQNYGIYVSNFAFSPVGWKIDNCRIPTQVNIIGTGSLPTLANWSVSNISEGPSSNGHNIAGAIQGGNWSIGQQKLVVGSAGTPSVPAISNCSLTMDTSYITVNGTTYGAANASTAGWTVSVDMNEIGTVNRTFSPGIATTVNGWTISGTLTQRGRLCYDSNRADWSLFLSATSIAWTANATIVMPFAVIDTFLVTAIDSSTGALISYGTIVNSSTGSTVTLQTSHSGSADNVIIAPLGAQVIN